MECDSAVKAGTESQEPGANLRYPKQGRLLSHADFERVYKQGRRHFSQHMTVFYLPRAKQDAGSSMRQRPASEQKLTGMRIGFTVSRALGGAVDRNRMKRRLRETVRNCWPKISPCVDVVVNPKKSLLTADFEGLQREIRRAFEVITQKAVAKSPARD